MTKQRILDESKLVDLNDKELLEVIGSLHEIVKRLQENKKKDEVLVEMREKLKSLEDELYNTQIKDYQSKLKASRHLGRIRGIKIPLPKGVHNEE